MVTFKGLEAEVLIDNLTKPLQEYTSDDDPSTENSVTRYVKAISGAEFALRVYLDADAVIPYGVSCCVYVDGEKITKSAIPPRYLASKTPYIKDILGRKTCQKDGTFLERTQFSTIQLNTAEEALDSEKLKSMSKRVAKIGTIEVHILRIIYHGRRGSSKFDDPKYALGAVPEKALKGQALSHTTSFLNREKIAHRHHVETTYVDATPYAKFIFKYRSRAALQAMLIIPRDPSPESSPPPPSDPYDDMSPEELRRLLRQQNVRFPLLLFLGTRLTGPQTTLVKQERGVKRERRESSTVSRVSGRIKQEAVVLDLSDEDVPTIKKKKTKMQVIDLTDD
ncbi:MAG: hypothetical protein M1834_004565 [Cirrosporium novae-zelandiae]|nr:MAG: hypothetical protein M1834_004565 [Cirrosporium novae-zelandiae]